MQASDLVLRFISSIGGPREADYYLSLFRSARPEAFAVIAVSDAVIREAEDALVVDLRFLSRLGLTPVILLGLCDPACDPASARQQAELLAELLRPDVACELVLPTDASTAAASVATVARAGAIPLVPMGTHREPAAARNRQAELDAVAAMVAALGTRKVVFLERQSGLEPRNAPVPSLVDITREYDALAAALPEEQAALLGNIRHLIHAVPHRLTVAVTSPLDLLRELFTMSGAGTLVRRGSVVTRYQGYGTVDRERMRQLLETAFDKPLASDFFDRPIAALYVAEDVRGLAILNDTPHGLYLSKFAVDRQAQGEGVGRDLWRVLVADHETIIWRSRPDNPISAWYQQQCDGMVRSGRWLVFWRGLPVERIPEAVQFAASAPPDFAPPAARVGKS